MESRGCLGKAFQAGQGVQRFSRVQRTAKKRWCLESTWEGREVGEETKESEGVQILQDFASRSVWDANQEKV